VSGPQELGTRRFSMRASHYDQGRPSYPPALLDFYRDSFHLAPGDRVADIGSGTGIHAALFGALGVSVAAVEPNESMRRVAEERFAHDSWVRVLSGSAESTTLPDDSVDFVVAAQAFHWFDPAAFRVETRRILSRPGATALVWNIRSPLRSEFTHGYEVLLQEWGTGYREIRESWGEPAALERFFGSPPERVVFPNDQRIALSALESMIDSSSYMPMRNQIGSDQVRRHLGVLFEKHADGEAVTLAYDTVVYYAPARWPTGRGR